MQWTEEMVEAHQKKMAMLRAGRAKSQAPPRELPTPQKDNPAKQFVPNFRKHEKGMNKMETRYSIFLEAQKSAGEILDWRFEPVKLRLADNTFYNIDFMVTCRDRIELHEVKGHWEDDARVKWKVAAESFWMFQFVAIQWKGGKWVFERYNRGE